MAYTEIIDKATRLSRAGTRQRETARLRRLRATVNDSAVQKRAEPSSQHTHRYHCTANQSPLPSVQRHVPRLTCLYGGPSGGHLVTHAAYHLGRGAHEPHAGVLARLREVGALREEPVARVDRVHVVVLWTEARRWGQEVGK